MRYAALFSLPMLVMPMLALAQSNIQVFGVMDTGVALINRGNGSHVRVDSGVANTSRWGIRGREELGNGLTAFFHLEGEIDVDTGLAGAGQSAGFQRGAYLGLQGDFGQIWMGRDYQSGFYALQTVDINGLNYYGNLLTFLSGYPAAGGVASTSGMLARVSNGVYWKSPNLRGIQVAAHHALGERDTDPLGAGHASGMAVFYKAGPLSLTAWYHDRKELATTTGATSIREWGGGGSYNFGITRIALGFGAGNPEGPRKLTFASLGASVPIGADSLRVQFLHLKESASAARAMVPSIAYQRPLSRRTALYLSAATTRNNGTGNFMLHAAGSSITPAAIGTDPRGIALGVRHAF